MGNQVSWSTSTIQCLQRWWSNPALLYPCSFIKQTVGFTHTRPACWSVIFDSSIPWELWKRRMESVEEYVLARIWRSWKSSSTSAQRMQLSPCDRHSAGNEFFSWLPERPWQPTCQPWVKGRGSNSEEQVDGEAGSMAVKEQIWQSYSWEHGRDQQIMGMGIATTNC